MSSMWEQPNTTLSDLAKHVGLYSEEAFLFVREGLSFAADQIHGQESDAHRALHQFMARSNLDFDELVARFHSGELPEPVIEAIDAAGGCEKLNRHVSGRELCWSLRDFALKRWGLMARTVLESWNIKGSKDFGRVVFAFIEFDMMRKQDEDTLEDFENVYSFDEVFQSTLDGEWRKGDSQEP